MSDRVMLRLTGWSQAQLAAWRLALRQPVSRNRVDRLRGVLPAVTVDSAIERVQRADPGPVGESLAATFDELSLSEQRQWRALAADDGLSPQQRCEAMRTSLVAERQWLRRLCDAAIARAQAGEQGRLFTDAELGECIPERLKLPAH